MQAGCCPCLEFVQARPSCGDHFGQRHRPHPRRLLASPRMATTGPLARRAVSRLLASAATRPLSVGASNAFGAFLVQPRKFRHRCALVRLGNANSVLSARLLSLELLLEFIQFVLDRWCLHLHWLDLCTVCSLELQRRTSEASHW